MTVIHQKLGPVLLWSYRIIVDVLQDLDVPNVDLDTDRRTRILFNGSGYD
jgi:hypothetical protein